MDDQLPYLPDILKGVVERVNNNLSFEVFFDYGLYQDVSKNIYKGGDQFPLVWLVMNFTETRGKRFDIYADVSAQIIIGMPTEIEYSMQERVDINFKPRLLPIYRELLKQISKEKNLMVGSVNMIQHSKIDLPYWGGGENTGSENLWKKFIDAIQIKDLKLLIKHKNC